MSRARGRSALAVFVGTIFAALVLSASPAAASPPRPLLTALEAYEDGRYFDVLAALGRIPDRGRFVRARDEKDVLRALSFLGLGWDDEALPLLSSILATTPPSPYLPLALLEIVELHLRAGRTEAAIDAFERHFETPLAADDERSREIADLVYDFGALRSGSAKLTPSEKQILARPEELAVLISGNRERVAERLLYRAGIAYLRLGEHRRSLVALRRIGITSPYAPWALYAMGQNLHALDEEKRARRILDRLVRYPETTPGEKALENRARLLKARLQLLGDDVEGAITTALTVPADDPDGQEAELLILEALVDDEKPSLALAYAREEPGEGRLAELAAIRRLALGQARSDLGDRKGAARELRLGLRAIRKAKAAGESSPTVVSRLLRTAKAHVREGARLSSRTRSFEAKGILQVVAYDGWDPWWTLERMRRTVGEILGERPHGRLALGRKRLPREAASDDPLWLALLGSDRFPEVERVLGVLDSIEEPRAPSPLLLLNAHLVCIEGERIDAASAARVVEDLRALVPMPIPALTPDLDVPSYRAHLGSAPIVEARGRRRTDRGTASVRAFLHGVLAAWAEGEIRSFLDDRSRERSQIERALELTLVRTLAADAGVAKDPARAR